MRDHDNERSINDFLNMDVERSHDLDYSELKELAQRYFDKISYIDREYTQLIDIQEDTQELFYSLDSDFTYDDREPIELRKVRAIRHKALPGIEYLIYLCNSRMNKTIDVYDYLMNMAKLKK